MWFWAAFTVLRRPDKYTGPANFWNISDWQRTRHEWQNKGVASKDQTLLWRIVNRKSVRRTIVTAGWWSLDQDLVAGAGLDSWYKADIRWIGGRWCRTGFHWCRSGRCWHLLVQESGRWFRTGSCWCRTGSCWYLLVQEGGRRCRAGSCWCRLKGC